jgi:rod shape-determining protein MreD
MMQNIIISLILFLSVILQVSFLPNIFPTGSIPDVALIIIMIWIARADFNSVLKWAIFSGLMMDIASYQPIGLNIFVFMTVAFIVNSFSKRFLVPQLAWKFFMLSIIIIIGTIVSHIIIVSFVEISGHLNNLPQSGLVFFNREFFMKIIYNLAIFAVLYWPLKKLDKIFAYQNNRVIIKR